MQHVRQIFFNRIFNFVSQQPNQKKEGFLPVVATGKYFRLNFQFIMTVLAILLFSPPSLANHQLTIKPGAEQPELYLPLLKNKRVALFANHSSMIGNQHLVDFLMSQKINLVKVFSPEHGFRGTAADGDLIKDTKDKKTGLSIISLYGKKFKPSGKDLENVDVLVFDIQDVGVRFYTYISSLQKLMETAVTYNKPLIVLDRPNPNGFYVDGPVLQKKYKSFTGMQPIPIVYGLTMGEYAKLLIGEEWLEVSPKSKAKQLSLTVIPCANYTHNSHYIPPIKPSPNLPDIQSIYWYPSIGIMEGTVLSVGRGTDTPFQVYGHPLLPEKFSFIPRPREGAIKPLFEGQVCHGWDLRSNTEIALKTINNQFQVDYIIKAYQAFPDKKNFFKKSFDFGIGNGLLRKQIINGSSEIDIRKSWEPELNQYKIIRKKYLMYPDFDPK